MTITDQTILPQEHKNVDPPVISSEVHLVPLKDDLLAEMLAYANGHDIEASHELLDRFLYSFLKTMFLDPAVTLRKRWEHAIFQEALVERHNTAPNESSTYANYDENGGVMYSRKIINNEYVQFYELLDLFFPHDATPEPGCVSDKICHYLGGEKYFVKLFHYKEGVGAYSYCKVDIRLGISLS